MEKIAVKQKRYEEVWMRVETLELERNGNFPEVLGGGCDGPGCGVKAECRTTPS